MLDHAKRLVGQYAIVELVPAAPKKPLPVIEPGPERLRKYFDYSGSPIAANADPGVERGVGGDVPRMVPQVSTPRMAELGVD